MNAYRSADRLLVGMAAVVLAAVGCGGGPAAATPTPPTATASAAPTPTPSPTDARTPAVSSPTSTALSTPGAGWAVVRTSCPEARGEPFLLVAIGTSESAGPGEYPEVYADMLCEQLRVPVVLHGFYPSTDLINGLAPLRRGRLA